MPRLKLSTNPKSVSCDQKRKIRTNNKLAKMYNPKVATNETTILRKMEFVKKSPKVSTPFLLFTAILLIPWNARKNAEN
jgi:hypothetical protein